MKKLFFIFLVFFLFNTNSFAKYSFYTCTKGTDAYSCSGSCEESKDNSVDLKVNTQTNTVIFLMYKDKKLVLTQTLDSCKIVDSKNWECDEDFGMVGNQWYSRSKAIARSNPDVDFGMCGKYSLFK
jgi:hypothetical protein